MLEEEADLGRVPKSWVRFWSRRKGVVRLRVRTRPVGLSVGRGAVVSVRVPKEVVQMGETGIGELTI